MSASLPPTLDLEAMLRRVVPLAEEAAVGVCRIYRRTFKVDYKEDKSPLTEADLFAHKTIENGLMRIEPRLPVLSEESDEISYAERSTWETYWLVDPLDGTREFVKKRDDFTVNIALIHRHRAILGVVYVPVMKTCYMATLEGGARKLTAEGQTHTIRARKDAQEVPTIAVSISHTDATTRRFLEKIGKHNLVRRGSLLKCCLIAEGKADFYPRFGKTGEWDTAAGQCILEEAGGTLTDFSGNPLRYNTRQSLINPSFVACGPAAPDWRSHLQG